MQRSVKRIYSLTAEYQRHTSRVDRIGRINTGPRTFLHKSRIVNNFREFSDEKFEHFECMQI